MQERRSDRRKANRNIDFPLTDGLGAYVGADRRSGLDRRNYKSDEVALDIVSLVNN